MEDYYSDERKFINSVQKIDEEVLKLQPFDNWAWNSSEYLPADEFASGFINSIEKLIGALGATEIKQYNWDYYCKRIDFNPVTSQYKKQPYDLIDSSFKGTITLGFEGELGYKKNDSPELITWYTNERGTSGILLYSPNDWRHAISHFFRATVINNKLTFIPKVAPL